MMDAFPLPREDAKITEAHQRLGAQQQTVEQVVGAVATRLAELRAPANDAVGQIERAMKKIARQRVRDQENTADYIVSQMAHQAGTRLAGQQMIVNDLTGATMSGSVPRPADRMAALRRRPEPRAAAPPASKTIGDRRPPRPPVQPAQPPLPPAGPAGQWGVYCGTDWGAGPVVANVAEVAAGLFPNLSAPGVQLLSTWPTAEQAFAAQEAQIAAGNMCGPNKDKFYVICRPNMVPTAVPSESLPGVFFPFTNWTVIGGPFDTLAQAVAFAQLAPRNACDVGGPPDIPPDAPVNFYRLWVNADECAYQCRLNWGPKGEVLPGPLGYVIMPDVYATADDCDEAGVIWQAACKGEQPPLPDWWEVWGNTDTCDAVCLLRGEGASPGYLRIIGPYFDRGECELAATEWEDKCAAPPPSTECPIDEPDECPPAFKPPLTADDDCKMPGFPASIPVPGSEEWCRKAPEIRSGLVAAGKWLLDFAANDISEQVEELPEWGGLLVKTSPMYWLIRYNRAVARWLIDWLFDARTKLNKMIVCWRALVKLSPGCDAEEVLALAVVRGVVGMLEHFRFGVELPVLAATELGIHLPQLSRALDYLIEGACPSKIPGPPEAMEAYLHGQIDHLTYRCWLEAHGVSADVVNPILVARARHLEADETIEWGRRNDWDNEDIKKEVENRAWLRQPDLDRKMELYDELPTTGEFLHWMMRNVFDEDYVRDYRLMDGFEERFWARFGKQLRAKGYTKERAANEYAAHWLPSSPSEMREWMFRLRPGKPGVTAPFTTADYKRLLVEQDKPPRHIQWYMDTAYNVPAFSYLTLLYRFHLIDDVKLLSYLQDQGYMPEDAKLMAQGMGAMKARTREEDAAAYTPERIGDLFRAGLMKENEARQKLRDQGFSPSESNKTLSTAVEKYALRVQDRARSTARTNTWRAILNAYQTGTVGRDAAQAALVAAGWPEDAVSAILAVGDVKARDALAKKAIASIRSAYLDGQLSDVSAQTALTSSGITDQRAAEYAAEWQLERLANRPHASVSQILSWVAMGLLPVRTARQRLLNLGWADPDLLLQLAMAQLRLAEKEKREFNAAEAALKKTTRPEPMPTLKERYRAGAVDRAYVEASLHARGYSATGAALIIDGWEATAPTP